MKNLSVAFAVAALAALVSACTMNSAELGEHVKKEMQSELSKKSGLKGLKMTEVRLVKGEGVSYSGVGKGEIDGCAIEFDVTCKYDGKTVLWNATPSEGWESGLVLRATKEKAEEIVGKLKAVWPEMKKSIGETCDAAAKKAGECYDSAKKKAGECPDAAEGKKSGDAGK